MSLNRQLSRRATQHGAVADQLDQSDFTMQILSKCLSDLSFFFLPAGG
jgi:hypothetical protein